MRVWTVAALVAGSLVAQSTGGNRLRIDADAYLSHVRFLASDELGGRGNGTIGLARAAAYIEAEFTKAGLEPGGDAGTYRQRFDLAGRKDVPASLTVTSAAGEVPFKLGAQFHPLSASDVPEASASRVEALPIIFAGYGISAPGMGYDDFASVDVHGAAVVVFTHEPQEANSRSVFAGTSLTPFSAISSKADEAARRGARLLIVVEDPSHLADRARAVSWFEDPQIGDYRIPVVRMDRVRLSRALGGLDFEKVARAIDDTLTSRSMAVTGATIALPRGLAALNPRGVNVIGILRGTQPAASAEAIVIGAHYDHLGDREERSREAQGAGQVHNGADDNASGTSLVLEIARTAARQPSRLKRTLVFALFAGEEVGLIGSRHYVQHPPFSMRRTAAMLNLDMVGRANGRVMVGGAMARSPLVTAITASSALRIDDFSNGYDGDSSDNYPFEREKVPTLLFFTGFHDDYHRPSDDWERIDARGAAEIGRIALESAAALANR